MRRAIILAVMTFGAVAVMIPLRADEEKVGDYTWTYRINGDTAEINNNYSVAISPSPTGALSIPSTLGGKPVTSIGAYAFAYCSGLTSVTIPDSVTSIGDSAFSGCSGLTSVTIPDSVTSIGDSAFSGCSGLTSVTIPDSVTSIGDSAFSDCSGLTSLTIPNSVTSIGAYAFCNCSGLTSVTIPNGVTNIGEIAFAGCSGLTSVTIPDSVTSIGDSAFSDCSGLTSLTIPNSVTSIGAYAFCNCSGLTSVTIPNGVTNIGEIAFAGCSGLTSVIISPARGLTVGGGAFHGCNQLGAVMTTDLAAWFEIEFADWSANPLQYAHNLYTTKQVKELVVPDGVGKIGSFAFTGCSFTNVVLSATVTNIMTWAFYGCSGLTRVTIPDSVTSIGDSAFSGCSGLTRVTIPDSVTSIGDSAFEFCSGLTSVTIPDSVRSIGNRTFYACSGLTSVTIPNSVTSIGDEVFWCCSGLTSVTIPASVTNIGDYAFCYCSGLTSVTIPDSVTSIGDSAFSRCTSVTNLTASFVPPYLAEQLTSVTIPDSVTSIRNSAFNNCSGLTSVTIPDSVTNIGNSAFCYCSGLMSVTIGNGVTSIGDNAFARCSGLTSVTIPASVTSIGDNAFARCSGLTSVTIPASVTSIGDNAFARCSGLTSVTIPASVTNIGDYAFCYCSGLMSVTIGNDVTIPTSETSIRDYAFYNCSGLTSVTIGNGVTSIRDYAFYNCSGLTSVHITDLAAWCRISFGSNYANPFCYAHNLYLNGSLVTDLTIPASVTGIGDYAFCNYNALTSVTIPDSVTSIGGSAFSSCSRLKWVVVPSSVTSIGANALSSCSSLKAVYLLNSVPPSTGGNIYSGTSTDLTTYVPEGSTGWLFPNLPVLPETWPTGDDTNGRAIEFGSPVFVDVSFDANGGEVVGTVPGIKWIVGVDGFSPMPGATRDGYSFLGWFTAREGGDKVTTNTVVASDMTTLYAHWAEGVAFDMGGNADWTQETDGCWRSGAIGSSQTTWMEMTVYGEGEISFKWKVSSYSYYGKLYFYVDGVQKDYIGGEVGWTDKTFVVSGKGAHTLRWAYSKTSSYTSGSDCGWVDAVVWNPYVECMVTFDAAGGSLGGAAATRSVYKGQAIGELPMPTKDGFMFMGWWTAGGERVTAETVVTGTLALTARWEVNPFTVGVGSNWAQDGNGGWKSGVTAHNVTNSITMSVVGTGTIAFDWKASCESFYRTYRLDYLAFLIDGVEQGFINGETDWISAMFDVVSTGDHTLTWSYIKDSEGVVGQDCAWLRGVTWTPSAEAGLAAWLAERNLTADARAANGRTAAECYALGLDPELATNDFRIVSIELVDGKPKVEWEPKTNRWTGAGIQAVLKGATTLDGEWKAVEEATAAEKAAMRFFKVVVEVQ